MSLSAPESLARKLGKDVFATGQGYQYAFHQYRGKLLSEALDPMGYCVGSRLLYTSLSILVCRLQKETWKWEIRRPLYLLQGIAFPSVQQSHVPPLNINETGATGVLLVTSERCIWRIQLRLLIWKFISWSRLKDWTSR